MERIFLSPNSHCAQYYEPPGFSDLETAMLIEQKNRQTRTQMVKRMELLNIEELFGMSAKNHDVFTLIPANLGK